MHPPLHIRLTAVIMFLMLPYSVIAFVFYPHPISPLSFLVTDFWVKRITPFTNRRKTAIKTEVFLKNKLQKFIFLKN